MIYSMFMRKVKGDNTPFPTTLAVNQYMKSFLGANDVVICFPGYMTVGSAKNPPSAAISGFLGQMSFPKYTYFTVGMIGNRPLTKGIPTPTIQDEHNKHFNLQISGQMPSGIDHAKMMFFLKNTQPLPTTTINNQQVANISVATLLSMPVKAVLIGSSNQSLTTYFGGSANVADKGEADILLFDASFRPNYAALDENKQDEWAEKLYSDIMRSVVIALHQTEGMRDDIQVSSEDSLALFKQMSVSRISLHNIFMNAMKS